MKISHFQVNPISMVDWQNQQQIQLSYHASYAGSAQLCVVNTCGEPLVPTTQVAISSGEGISLVRLPQRQSAVCVTWILQDTQGTELARFESTWSPIRPWTIHLMISSHTDIGLHNSQYIQRANSEQFIDAAMALCDQTASAPEATRYRYVMEGTWFWNNYPADQGEAAARRVVEEYVKPGKMGIAAGVAGNCTWLYGLEEMCRSTYGRCQLLDQWGVDCRTLTMVDNNGLSWGMIQPYVDAGYQHILFSPNQWNPRPSTIWKRDTTVPGYIWNTEAGGGGARIDLRLNSNLPMVFFWESADAQHKLLVWGCGKYQWAAQTLFGTDPWMAPSEEALLQMEDRIRIALPKMEARFPFDLWLSTCYADDQPPSLGLTHCLQQWNARWQWPRFRTVGSLDAPFDELKSRFSNQIPVLRGDITAGWCQLAVSAPDCLAEKFEADRLLPTAEKLAVVAALTDATWHYPAESLNQAWDALLWNDEHSYGCSGYQGRRVFETWMQHRDWVEKATQIADQTATSALAVVASQIPVSQPSLLVFNPTAQCRNAPIFTDNGQSTAWIPQIPPMGYRVIPQSALTPVPDWSPESTTPPTLENAWYRVRFSTKGAIISLFDKDQQCELLDLSAPWGANQFVYTQDNHRSFSSPSSARFSCREFDYGTCVRVLLEDPLSGAEIEQIITLWSHEKAIDLENHLRHVRGLFNDCRYDRFVYMAFPFALQKPTRRCQLNGCIAEYGRDLTGHSTDVYMAASEWCYLHNHQANVALIQRDSQLVEFDHIHPDKTDFGNPGEGSALFVYCANDWLQMHTTGGSHINLQFRFRILSGVDEPTVAATAERFVTPLRIQPLSPQIGGTLPSEAHSFVTVPQGQRLLTLKRAEDGNGLIARLWAPHDQAQIAITHRALTCERASTHEGFVSNALTTPPHHTIPTDNAPNTVPHHTSNTFVTLRLGANEISLPTCPAPTPKNATYTGLIDTPRAGCGEADGQLYLLWGRDPARDLSHYELFRGNSPDFIPDSHTFVTRVNPESYCVGRFVDEGLKTHTQYWYRVRSVYQSGQSSPFSSPFSGTTREPTS